MNYKNRLVWLKKQKRLTVCVIDTDDKCTVAARYINWNIYWKVNLLPLSPVLPKNVVNWLYNYFKS